MVVAPGLESFAVDELRALGVTARTSVGRGGVEVELSVRQLYAVHRWSRVATRVLVRVAGGRARQFHELEDLVGSVDWGRFVAAGAPVAVHASSQGSRLYHEGAIVERVARQLGRPLGPDGQRVYLRVDHDRVTLSVDASGASLHHRGWRREEHGAHAAPVRATIAAAMIRAAAYDGSVPLIDPMTGSGTIAVEGASVALRRPQERAFAFQSWPAFEPGTWASVSAPGPVTADATVVYAADRDEGAVRLASVNARAAGVDALVRTEHAPLTAQRWPDTAGVVVCNPPYGRRLGDVSSLRDLYAALGRRVAEGGHRLYLLAADERLARATGLELAECFATSNGGIAVRCWTSAHTPGRVADNPNEAAGRRP